MNIIFNEYNYALKLLDQGFSSYMNWRDLAILSRYYRYIGLEDFEIRINLVKFCLKFFPEYNEIRNGYHLDNAIRNSRKNKLKISKGVMITKSELNSIRNENNYRYEKILFAMLVLAKNSKAHSNSTCGEYFVNQNFSAIVSIAKVYVNKEERENIKHQLFLDGMFKDWEPNKVTNNSGIDSFCLAFVNDNSGSAIFIPPEYMNDYMLYFPRYCKLCGKPIENNYRQEYCLDCRQNMSKEIKRNWWKRNTR